MTDFDKILVAYCAGGLAPPPEQHYIDIIKCCGGCGQDYTSSDPDAVPGHCSIHCAEITAQPDAKRGNN